MMRQKRYVFRLLRLSLSGACGLWQADAKRHEAYLDVLEQQEALSEQMSDSKEMEVSVVICPEVPLFVSPL